MISSPKILFITLKKVDSPPPDNPEESKNYRRLTSQRYNLVHKKLSGPYVSAMKKIPSWKGSHPGWSSWGLDLE